MQGMKSDAGAQQGFTLVEMLIAIAILSVGLLAAASMQGISLQSDMLAIRGDQSTMIMQQVVEDLKSVDVKIGSIWNVSDNPPAGIFRTAAVNLQYTRFPPFDGVVVTTPTSTYMVPGVGVFSATYTVRPNTPSQNITEVQVAVNLTVGARNITVPYEFVLYRALPTSY